MRAPVLVVVLLALGAASLIASISFGAVSLPISTTWAVIAHHLLGVGPAPDVIDNQIVWDLRAPRAVLAFLVGAGLSVAGVVLQALVRNPLADPYVLGVESGASLGAVAVIAFGSAAVAGLTLSGAAFLGAITTMIVVLMIARQDGGVAPNRLLLAGVAIAYLCSSGTSFIQFLLDPRALQRVLFWLLGSVAGATWSNILLPAIALLLVAAWLMTQSRRLDILLLGDESATSLGVSVQRFRIELLIAASILVGTLVAVAGAIGFVGLMIPHITRMLIGPSHRRLLPISMLLGGVFLVWVDVLARWVAAPSELPIGIFTAGIGAPFFLWLMRRSPTRKARR